MNLIRTGVAERGTLLLAHGAGAPADSPFMETFAHGMVKHGFEVVRFNFPYMEKRMEDGRKRPPDRAPKLLDAFLRAIEETNAKAPLIIGGKSMGGRIASMIAAEHTGICDGLVCLGYPFHPPGKPDRLRTAHLADIKVPTLLVQGERDPFGNTALLETVSLPSNFQIHWAPDGNHDLAPRKASGFTKEENWAAAMDAIATKFG